MQQVNTRRFDHTTQLARQFTRSPQQIGWWMEEGVKEMQTFFSFAVPIPTPTVTRHEWHVTYPLKELSHQLLATPHLDKFGSYIASKIRPILDTIGSWLEDRLNKFTAGEGEGAEEKSPEVIHIIKEGSGAAGPFSKYSFIPQPRLA